LIEHIHKHNFKIPFNSFYHLKFKSTKSNSWFTIKKAKINNVIDMKFTANNNNNDAIIKCSKVTIQPSDEQRRILFNWFESYRKTYNETLRIIKQLIYDDDVNRFNFRFIRTHKMKEFKAKLIEKSKINSHILDGAIKLATSSYKSANSNLRSHNIENFNIRPIKQNKKSKIIDIERCYFHKTGLCKRILGTMKTNCRFDFSTIKSDCKVHYNKLLNRFTLLVPEQIDPKINNNKDFISIDPGLKTFLTGISTNKIYKIGDNLVDTYKHNLKRIDKLAKINNKKSRKNIESIKRNSFNKITDLHWKSINYLLNTEKKKDILIGNWSTKDISSNERYLDTINKRIANGLRFYDFIQKLTFKCTEYSANLKVIDESYTSKICSFCKQLSTIRNDRTLKCSCGLNLDRDINGCINILLRSQ